MNNDIQNGFADMAEELAGIGDKITDKRTEIKALEAGAKPIVDRAKTLASRFKKSGRLMQSIGAQYSERSNTMRIGIGEPISTTNSSTGFYGRFHDKGWRPVRFQRNGRRGHAKKGGKRPTGRFIRNPIFDPAYNAEQERVFENMINVYRKELD